MILQILFSTFISSDVEFCEGHEIAPYHFTKAAECFPKCLSVVQMNKSLELKSVDEMNKSLAMN